MSFLSTPKKNAAYERGAKGYVEMESKVGGGGARVNCHRTWESSFRWGGRNTNEMGFIKKCFWLPINDTGMWHLIRPFMYAAGNCFFVLFLLLFNTCYGLNSSCPPPQPQCGQGYDYRCARPPVAMLNFFAHSLRLFSSVILKM